MQRFFLTLILVALSTATVAAQEARFRYATDPFTGEDKTEETKVADPVVTESERPSFSSYESSSPMTLVQQRALYKSQQRQMVLASRQWYGHSQSRPAVHANPYMAHYYPIVVGQTWSPYRTWHNTFSWY